jgi:hypothetical protein
MSYAYTSWTNTQIVASIALPSSVTEADWGVYVISDAWVLGSAAANPQDVEVPVEQSATGQITMGSPPMVVSGNAANSPNVVSVGQFIQLAGSVNNLGSRMIASQTWTVGGTTVKTYSSLGLQTLNLAASPPVCSAPSATQLQAADLTQPQIAFYWIDGDPGTNTVTNNVTYTATLSDGSTTPVVTAGFRPVKPSAISNTVEFNGQTTTLVPPINITTGQGSAATLSFGNSGGDLTDGITYNMNVSTTIGGNFALLQLVNYANTYTLASGGQSASTSNGVFVLDNGASSDGYPQYDGKSGIVQVPSPGASWTLVDDPNVTFAGATAVTVTQQFQTYLMYQPPYASSIWVTLQMMNWNWNGQSAFTNGAWTAPTAFPTGSTAFSQNPTGNNSTTLPTWGNCAKGSQ